jgi:hypothetical protein
MVCRSDEKYVMIRWDDKTIYGFIVAPSEYQKDLLNAFNKLPIICRKVMILYAFEGMQRQKIAEQMATSLAAIRFLIYHSGLLLHRYLKKGQDSEVADYELEGILTDWPYIEYAGLVELRKDVVLLG